MSTMEGRLWYTQVYLVSKHWIETRKKKLEKNPVCQSCHKKPSKDVHHKHYNTLWNEDIKKDLLALCRNCHYRKKHTKRWVLSLRASSFMTPIWNWAMQFDDV